MTLQIRVVAGELSTDVYTIVKPLTTIGGSRDCDIRIIEDPRLVDKPPGLWGHIRLIGENAELCAHDSPLCVNGNLVSKHALKKGDVCVWGRTVWIVEEHTIYKQETATAPYSIVMDRFIQFSKNMNAGISVEELLTQLLDAVIQLTSAERGFIVLKSSQDGQDAVPVVRFDKKLTLAADVGEIPLSDSVVSQVLNNGESLVISNAMQSKDFRHSSSVMNFKLMSVMCVPLRVSSHTFGVIYVGNNSVASVFDEKSLDVLSLFTAQASLLVHYAISVNALNLEAQDLRKKLSHSRYGEIIGSCRSMQSIYQQLDKVSHTDISVMIIGETGTGKELIARELHRRSQRKTKPFVAVNCAAFPEGLIESELFGHVKGAFTGAIAQRMGLFEQAHQGTVFLDEIGEMPLHVQSKLLRVLQEKSVTRVGDSKPILVDVRVVAATHRSLKEMIEEKKFREDLYYRLNVVSLALPPLRERGDDVLVIASHLLAKFNQEMRIQCRGFTAEAKETILRYAWPGNIRQMENKIKRAMVLNPQGFLTSEDLDIAKEDLENILSLSDAVERFRRRYVDETLMRMGGNRTKTAAILGVDPRTIYRHLESVRLENDEEVDLTKP